MVPCVSVVDIHEHGRDVENDAGECDDTKNARCGGEDRREEGRVGIATSEEGRRGVPCPLAQRRVCPRELLV